MVVLVRDRADDVEVAVWTRCKLLRDVLPWSVGLQVARPCIMTNVVTLLSCLFVICAGSATPKRADCKNDEQVVTTHAVTK